MPVDLPALCDDLAAEHAALDAVVAGLDDAGWSTRTPAEGWDVRDSIAHVAFFDDAATLEPDPGAPRHDRGIDADDLALHVDERAAGIAGVDGGVGLEEVVEGALTDLARLRADDAGGDRRLQPER
jgi:hypothetical protein